MPLITFENVEVWGFAAAIRGMRNAMESWDKSDSKHDFYFEDKFIVGPNDRALMEKLIKTGRGSEQKFLRTIWIWCDLTLPLNVWNELDTYKVATTRLSCSTMHKIGSRLLTEADFVDGWVDDLERLNQMIRHYQTASGEVKKDLLIRIRRTLPWGFLQKATYNFNYATALHIYGDRHNHRLPEWHEFCAHLRELPEMSWIIDAAF